MKKKKSYTWVIVALSFMMIMISLGFCSSPKTLFLAAITDALDLKRSSFAINDTLRFGTNALCSIFFGRMIARFGEKKLIIIGFLSLIGSNIVNATATQLWQFYIGGFLLGVGIAWSATSMASYVIGKWCRKNKGTIMGAVLAANGIGGTVATQILTPIIYREGNAFSYRNAYWLVACLLVVVTLIILLFFRENAPEQEAADIKVKERDKNNGFEWDQIKRLPYFYCLLGILGLTGMAISGVYGVATASMRDLGLNTTFIANALSIHLLCLTTAKFLTGFLYDRFGLRAVTFICYGCGILASAQLALMISPAVGLIAAMGYSIISSFSQPLDSVVIPLYVLELFGERCYSRLLGYFVAAKTIGAALGSPISNLFYDRFGNYQLLFIIGFFLMLFLLIATQFLIKNAKKKMAVAQ